MSSDVGKGKVIEDLKVERACSKLTWTSQSNGYDRRENLRRTRKEKNFKCQRMLMRSENGENAQKCSRASWSAGPRVIVAAENRFHAILNYSNVPL